MLIRLIWSLANLNISRTLSFLNSFMNGINQILTLLKFIRPVKLLPRLRLSFSNLRENKFRHGFRDILNPLCPCSIESKIIAHYLLRCHFYNANRSALINELNKIDSSFPKLNENKFIDLILYGSDKFDDDKKNHNVLMCTINSIKDSQRFDKNLLYFFSY